MWTVTDVVTKHILHILQLIVIAVWKMYTEVHTRRTAHD